MKKGVFLRLRFFDFLDQRGAFPQTVRRGNNQSARTYIRGIGKPRKLTGAGFNQNPYPFSRELFDPLGGGPPPSFSFFFFLPSPPLLTLILTPSSSYIV